MAVDWGSMVGPAIQGAGALFSGAASGKQTKQQQAAAELANARQMQQGAYRDVASSEQNMYQNWLQDQFNRSNALQNARGIGEAQDFERTNALRAALLPAILKQGGGTGMDMSRYLAALSPEATQRSIAQRDMDLQSLMQGNAAPSSYGMQRGNPFLAQMQNWQQMQQQQGMGREIDMQGRTRSALEQNVRGATDYVAEAKKAQEEAAKSGGLGGLLGGALKTFGPLAIAAIPGIGPIASAALMAGTRAAGTKMQGGSWKDAGIAGAVGAAGPALGKIGGMVASKVANPVISQALKGGISGMAGGVGGAMAGAGMGAMRGAQQQQRNNLAMQQGQEFDQRFPVQGGMPQLGPPVQDMMMRPPDYFDPRALGRFQFGGQR